MTSFSNLSVTQKLRAALHRDVKAICTESCHFLGLEMTKSAMEIISELVYKKLAVYGADLEAFAKHGKRSTINADDVKLLVRRNPSLRAHLNIPATTTASAQKDKRRKTMAKNDSPKVQFDKTEEKPAEKPSVTDPGEDCVEDMICDDDVVDLTFE